MTLEHFVALLNQNLFFKEFSFSKNKFKANPQSEYELADHVILLDDLLMTFQLKERALTDHGGDLTKISSSQISSEQKWFERKILDKAKKQVRDTHNYLSNYEPISITNERGHKITITRDQINTWHDLILYSHPNLPTYRM